MAALTVQNASLTGTNPTANAAGASGDTITANSQFYLRITNAHASASRTVTIDDPTSVSPDGATTFNPDVAITVPALSSRLVKIASPGRFTNTSTGVINLTYSSNADLTIEVFQ
jgi:hypothetical protein